MSTSPQLSPLQFSVHEVLKASAPPPETVVLIHGFPDGPSMWRKTWMHLVDNGFRVVLVTLPGFESNGPRFKRVCFDEVVDRLRYTLIEAQAIGATIMGHDWGAILSYRLLQCYPDTAKRLICLEIGCAPRSLILTGFVLFYHALFNIAYVLRGPIGNWLMGLLCALLPQPSYPERPKPRAQHAWLYHQAWREGGSHGPWPFYYRNVIASWRPDPRMPFLFVYGSDGPSRLRFHTAEWRRDVTSIHELSREIGLPGHHWFFLESPDDFHRALDEFLAP